MIAMKAVPHRGGLSAFGVGETDTCCIYTNMGLPSALRPDSLTGLQMTRKPARPPEGRTDLAKPNRADLSPIAFPYVPAHP